MKKENLQRKYAPACYDLEVPLEKKVIEVRKVDDWQVETDTGFVDIDSINKTVPYQIWEIRTKNNKLEGAPEHVIFRDNWEQVYLKDLKVGDKIITKNGIEPVIFVKPTNRVENCYDLVLSENSNRRFYSNNILSHNSTLYTIFALHYCMFNPDKTVLLCANKEKTVKDLLNRIKFAYMKLPSFLKIGIVNWSAKEIEFENGSKIQITATSADSARGSSCDVCFNQDTWIIVSKDNKIYQEPIISLKSQAQVLISNIKKVPFKQFFEEQLDLEDKEAISALIIKSQQPGCSKQLLYHIIDAKTFTIPKCPICGKSLINRFKEGHYQVCCGIRCQREFNKKYKANFDKELKVLAPTGFEKFEGISINSVNQLVRIRSNDIDSYYSLYHKLKTTQGVLVKAEYITPLDGLIMVGNKIANIQEVEHCSLHQLVYDLVNIDNGHLFYSNGFLSHNCILDEAAFIPNNIMDEFTTSVFPTISSRPDGKIIAVSTPNGMGNWFEQTYHKAEYQQENDFIQGDITSADDIRWHHVKFPWYEHPDRDDNWKKKQLVMLGGDKRRFSQEFDCQFLGSSATLFDPEVIDVFKKQAQLLNDKYRVEKTYNREVHIYEEPIQDHVYVMGVDIGDGTGADYSVMQCYDITDCKNIRLAMVFGSNTIPPQELAFLTAKYGARYNCALVSGERNGVGTSFFDTLWNNFEYENILCYSSEDTVPDRPGIYSTNKNKLKACLWAKQFTFLATGDNPLIKLVIPDLRIIYEMEYFERKNKTGTITYAATTNRHDDYIMCFIWAMFPLIMNIADNALDVAQTFKTAFGLEIPWKLRNAIDYRSYTEKSIDEKFIDKNVSVNQNTSDTEQRNIMQQAIFDEMLGNNDNW